MFRLLSISHDDPRELHRFSRRHSLTLPFPCAARRMVSDAAYGGKAWTFIHDLTREVVPGKPPVHEDERIALKTPLEGLEAPSPRLNYYKTVPEAAFMLAQYGFLTRESLQHVVYSTYCEMHVLQVRNNRHMRYVGRTC